MGFFTFLPRPENGLPELCRRDGAGRSCHAFAPGIMMKLLRLQPINGRPEGYTPSA